MRPGAGCPVAGSNRGLGRRRRPPGILSNLAHIGPAAEVGVTLEDVQNVLVAVAPIVGTARVMSAAINITEALGFAIAVAEADIDGS